MTEEWGNREPLKPRFAEPADVTYLTTCCLLVPRDASGVATPGGKIVFLGPNA